MRCLHCGKQLTLLKKLGKGQFCSESHRTAYSKDQEDVALSRLIEEQHPPPVTKRVSQKESNLLQTPVAPVAGPFSLAPHAVEWSWRGLWKEDVAPVMSEPERVLPRLVSMRRAGLPVGAALIRGLGKSGRKHGTAKLRAVELGEMAGTRGLLAFPTRSGQMVESSFGVPKAKPVVYQPTIQPRQGKLRRSPVASMRIPSASVAPEKPRPHISLAVNILFSTEEPPLNLTKLYSIAGSAVTRKPTPNPVPAEHLSPPWDLVLPRSRAMSVSVVHPGLVRVTLESLAAGQGVAKTVPVVPIPQESKAQFPATSLLLNTNLGICGKLLWSVSAARGSERGAFFRLDTEPVPPPALALPDSDGIPKILFDPPRQGALTLSISPKSGGDLRRWSAEIGYRALDAVPMRPKKRKSPLAPSCDWVPRIARPQPMEVDFEPHNVALHAVGEMEPADPENLQVAISASLISLSGEPMLRLGRRMFSLVLGSVVAEKNSQTPIGMYSYVEEEGSRAMPSCGLIPRTPELAPPEFDQTGIAHVLMAKLSGAGIRLPRIPKWAAAGVAGAILAVGLLPSLVSPASGNPGTEKVADVSGLSGTLVSIQQNILKRAAVALTDDFRNGLSDWEGDGDWAQYWEYDASGFVRTGPLALYSPSLGLTDYRMEFLGKIDEKSLGWVVRAADSKNYQAVRLMIANPGPVPVVVVQRWTVKDGLSGPVKQSRLPMEVRMDTMYRVLMDLKGDDFTLTIQDKVVDSWVEPRLPRGGVGFFSGKGERARLSWVGVWHQYDALGRLCALIAPPVYASGTDTKE